MSIVEKSDEWVAKLEELKEELMKVLTDQIQEGKPASKQDRLTLSIAYLVLEIETLKQCAKDTRARFGDPRSN